MDPFDLAASRVPAVAAALSKTGEPYTDVFLHELDQSVSEASVYVKNGRFGAVHNSGRRSTTRGIALRVLRPERTGFSTTADLTADGIRDCLTSADLEPRPTVVEQSPLTAPGSVRDDDPVVSWSTELLDRCLSAHDSISGIRVRVSRIRARRLIAVGEETLVSDDSLRVEARAMIQLGSVEIPSVRSIRVSEARDSDDWLDAIAAELVERSRRRSGRRRQLAGSHVVVLCPGWGGVWMHEAIGHQLEADSILAGASSLSSHLGQTVAGDFVTIVDSGMAQGGRVRQEFDDEGVESQETVLVQDGRLVGVLTDRASSIRLGRPLSGNGRRAHYGQLPRSRMTNLLLKPGSISPVDLISNVRKGIYVSDVGHARYDPQSGLIHLDATEAQLIENGLRTDELAAITLIADAHSLLQRIAGVADDFVIDVNRGYCRKNSVVIPVGVGQPTTLITKMEVRPGLAAASA